MARRSAKRRAPGARKTSAARPRSETPRSDRSAHDTAHPPAQAPIHPLPLRVPLLAVPRPGASQRQAPPPDVPRPKNTSTAGSTSVGRTPSLAPGPAPLPAAQPMPRLARVSGAGGTAGAVEFVKAPFPFMGELRPHALGITYWFDPPTMPVPYEVVVRLTGRRLDVEGARTPADDFVVVATLAEVRPTSGRTALTQRVVGKAPGRWHVTADALARVSSGGDRKEVVRLPSAEAVGASTFTAVATMRAPGVLLGAWPAMVGLGVVVAIILQSVLARVHGLASGKVLGVALVASVLGALGAKVYYRLTHLKERARPVFSGLSVQGFVIVATATFVVGGAVQGLAVGHLLDATVPALLVGQAVGRLGCLLAGCCAGVPTSSRWGLWSSDRRVGTRRLPVQLMEAAAAASLAVVTTVIAWRVPPSWAGLLFIGGLAGYVLARQLLFPLRGLPRSTRHGRHVTMTLAALTLVTLGAALVA